MTRKFETSDKELIDRDFSNKKQTDWLPAAVLCSVILAIVVIAAYLFLATPAGQKTSQQTPVKKPGPVKKVIEHEKRQEHKPVLTKAMPATLPAAGVREKIPANTPPVTPVQEGLDDFIAFYPLDGNAYDVSGNRNHGTVHGATPTEDRFGNGKGAYRFDGVDDYIDIGRPLVSGDFTITFWLKSNGRQNQFAVPVSQGNMSYSGFNFTFTKGPYNGFSWGTWDKNKTPDANWGKSAWHTLDFRFPKDINFDLTWHHLAAARNDKSIRVYRDGKYQGESFDFPINYGNFKFNIGRASGNSDFNHRTFNGVIDDVRVYNRALSHAEIQALLEEGDLKE